MINCQAILRNLFELLDNEFGKTNADEFEKHLALCRKCCDRVEFHKAARNRLRQKAGAAPPDSFKGLEKVLDPFGK
ncbi:MAG: zf-HC2 domain-containing protein [Elusimicrobia bacterium]|nr:zf-HC2 domain-containing protein [Elusimicrobiota bacterium]